MNAKNGKGTQVQQRQDGPWPSDRAIVAMSRQLFVDHYVNRNLDAAMRHIAPDVTWIGPLACQRARNAEDMRRMLEPEYGTSIEMRDESWGVREVGDARVVVGVFGAQIADDSAPELEVHQSVTLVWAMSSAGPTVVHLHLSNAYDVPASFNRPAIPGEDAVGYVIDAVKLKAESPERLRFTALSGEVCYLAEGRIRCFDAAERGCTVVCEGGSFVERERLARMERRLPAAFVRIHRSCIVNAKRVVAIRRFEVVLDDLSTRPVAEHRYLEIAEAVEAAVGHSVREQ